MALDEFIFTHKPHIIVGTETWLSPNVNNNEVISPEWIYNIYRKDRPDSYGGVMIAVSKQINFYEMTELRTDCELLWTSSKLFVGAYYRPHIGDQCSIDQLNLSLQRPEIWLIDDFNVPCINWEFMSLSTNRTHVAQNSSLIDVMQEHAWIGTNSKSANSSAQYT